MSEWENSVRCTHRRGQNIVRSMVTHCPLLKIYTYNIDIKLYRWATETHSLIDKLWHWPFVRGTPSEHQSLNGRILVHELQHNWRSERREDIRHSLLVGWTVLQWIVVWNNVTLQSIGCKMENCWWLQATTPAIVLDADRRCFFAIFVFACSRSRGRERIEW